MPVCPTCHQHTATEGSCPNCGAPTGGPPPATPAYQPVFAAPPPATPAYQPMFAAPPPPRLRPLGTARDAAVAALSAAVVTDAVSAVAYLHRRNLIASLRAGRGGYDAIPFSDRLVTVATLASFVALIAAAIAFITWLYRSYGNLHQLCATRFEPGWAIGSWFVPFLNLVRPKQIVDELWRRADPGSRRSEVVHRGRVPAWINWWWALWIVSNGVPGFYTFRPHVTMAELQLVATVNAVADALNVVAALLAIVLVRRLTARYEGTGPVTAPAVPGPAPAG